ncbi:hypothetical protein NDN08_005413 [Rhodosorus marinus]|uniref:Uncharacterized protein n=1 Tax=Rhodosorus marinus TaxID=101924 RepID=A0AAV8V4D9_9RHOD|nr:hypothetical protein NDN08_005413 [Rhodosorus marinus]
MFLSFLLNNMLRLVHSVALVVRRPHSGTFSGRFLSVSGDSSVESEDDQATEIKEERRKGMFLKSKDMSLEELITVEGYLTSSKTSVVNMSTDSGLVRNGLQKVFGRFRRDPEEEKNEQRASKVRRRLREEKDKLMEAVGRSCNMEFEAVADGMDYAYMKARRRGIREMPGGLAKTRAVRRYEETESMVEFARDHLRKEVWEEMRFSSTRVLEKRFSHRMKGEYRDLPYKRKMIRRRKKSPT